jgi:hypothetical protein
MKSALRTQDVDDSKKTRWVSGGALHCTIRSFVLGYWLTVCLRSFSYVKDISRGRSYPFKIDYQYGVRGIDGSASLNVHSKDLPRQLGYCGLYLPHGGEH